MIWVLGFGTWLFALSCVFVYNDLSVDVQSALVELEKVPSTLVPNIREFWEITEFGTRSAVLRVLSIQ